MRFPLQKHDFRFSAMVRHSFYVIYAPKILQIRLPRHLPEDTPTDRANNAFGCMTRLTNAAYVLSAR